ncbi:Retrovirus-related Pol polyprotein from transposon RE1 [Vitis vinifera]|uniref:Retrovirus-related Pol polyprotein from transposon RE1 n=1 Tax=Vitis vinifera TaxID=29760 RepID=A0A438FXR9_VITVI|nr:Retrovirus-related Pol polyprotein from transposon RE1 [Vitis vinifera]
MNDSLFLKVTCMVVRTPSLVYIYLSFRVINSSEPSSDVFHSGPSLSSQTTPDNSSPSDLHHAGNLFRRTFRRTFPATSFSYTDHTKRSAWRRSPTSSKPGAKNPHAPATPHFSGRRVRRVRLFRRRASSSSRLTPTSIPTYLVFPSEPARTLLGILSPSALQRLSGEVSATFSPPNPCTCLGKCFFYLLVVLRRDLRPSPFFGGARRNLKPENYRSWSASVELWFMGQGYEDHWLPRSQQDLDLSTYIGQIASLKEEFLTVMPLTPDVGAHKHSLTSSSWSYLIGLRPDLESIRDQILGSSSVPSLDDVFARLLRISSTQTLPSDSASDSSVLVSQTTSRGGRSGTRGRGQRPHCTYCNKLGHTRDRCYQLHGRPPRTAHMAQSSDSPLLSLRAPPHLNISGFYCLCCPAGNASACLTHTSSLGPWILDSGASDHLSGNKDLFSSITTTSDLPTVTLANGSQTVAKGIGLALPLPSLPLTSDRSTGKTIGVGRESQGLYHLTSDSSPAVCISTDAPLLIHNRLGHPSLSKFQKMVPRFLHFVVASVPIYFIYVSSWNSSSVFLCSYSSTNGVAERKNRHLVETARTLLLHSHIPHSLLFPDQPLYFLPPRVFGCTCFVHILTPEQDKLSAKAMKCLFLGYSRLQKGYRCYSLETHRYFISADVYHRRPHVVAPLPFPEAPADSLPILRLHLPRLCLLLMTYPLLFGKSTHEALSHPGWRQAMVDEMAALHSNSTWDLVVLPSGKSTVGCRWVYALKVGPDDCFCPLASLHGCYVFLAFYQLDIKNAFLHGDLAEEVYMEQPPGFVAQGESGLVCRLRRSLYGLKQSPRAWFSHFSSVVQEFGMLRSTADHSVFYHHNSLGQCIYLVVYVDDIVITGSDQDGIQKLKQHLFTHFQTKDLGKLKYFLGIEITQSNSGVVLSQRKYALDILEETGMLDCKPVDTPMDPNVKLVPGQGEPLGDPGDIDGSGHTQVVGYTDADWAGSPTDRRSTSGYYVFIGGNLISWKSKKQDVVARSSAEAEYRAMALATCELIWLRHLLQELRFGKDEQMKLICDNQATLHIASNPVFHERTKHIEVDCHFIREKIASGCVATSFVNSNDQLADIFTKSLRGPRIKYICNKLGAYDVYAPA